MKYIPDTSGLPEGFVYGDNIVALTFEDKVHLLRGDSVCKKGLISRNGNLYSVIVKLVDNELHVDFDKLAEGDSFNGWLIEHGYF